MIERLELTDYQRHAKLDVWLDPGITTITGPSDSGKSSIIRAIQAAALNRFTGMSFARQGSGEFRVRVKVDGGTIVRERSKSENNYSCKGKQFKAFGRDVPPDVFALANLAEINFQNQHDPPFWFGLSPGELAKQLNAIVDLEAIDEAMSKVAAILRIEKAAETVCEDRLAGAKRKLAKVVSVATIDSDLAKVESLAREADRAGLEWESLKEVCERAFGQSAEVSKMRSRLDAGRIRLNGLGKAEEDLGVMNTQLQLGKSLTDRIRVVENELSSLSVSLADAKKKLKSETGGLCPLCGGKLG
jgi:exonuclease SbcC